MTLIFIGFRSFSSLFVLNVPLRRVSSITQQSIGNFVQLTCDNVGNKLH